MNNIKVAAVARALSLGALIVVQPAARAAQDGELWEMTMEMSMPGMPAGMGTHTTQRCQGKDWRTPPGAEDGRSAQCAISEYQQTDKRVTYKATCAGSPPTTVSMDLRFEQSRSRMRGTMRVQSAEGTMITKLSGRRIGVCDVAQAAGAEQAALARRHGMARDMERQGREAQRRQQVMAQQADAQAGGQCAAALEAMNAEGWTHATSRLCYSTKEADLAKSCSEWASSDTTGCFAKFAEFCRRFETQAGFEKTSNRALASQMCGVPLEPLVERFCPAALEREAMDLLREHCPVQQKMLAQERCHGPDYSWSHHQDHVGRHKYYQLCTAHCMEVDCGPSRTTQAAEAQASEPAGGAGRAINQGLNKLKGLFGR